jgi:hypothetical protein
MHIQVQNDSDIIDASTGTLRELIVPKYQLSNGLSFTFVRDEKSSCDY